MYDFRKHYETEDLRRNTPTSIHVVVGWDQCSKSLIQAFYDETDALKYCLKCNKKPPKFAWHKTFKVESIEIQ